MIINVSQQNFHMFFVFLFIIFFKDIIDPTLAFKFECKIIDKVPNKVMHDSFVLFKGQEYKHQRKWEE